MWAKITTAAEKYNDPGRVAVLIGFEWTSQLGGNNVNAAEATYTNAIGAPVIETYWKDPAFDPKQRAFYYVRVIEIPTPRWTTYDAKFFGVALPKDVPASIQDRAYTSPIWYTPG